MTQILEHLLARHEEMIATLERLVMLDSPTYHPPAVEAVGGFLADAFAALGARVECLPQATYASHLRISWGQGERQLLLLGHMDTVWPLGEAERRPFSVQRESPSGARLATGPGVTDMKGGLVVGLYAIAALHALALAPAHRLVLLLNSDEEVGSLSSRPLIEEEARKSDYVLVLEPALAETLVIWRKGVGRFELEVRGVASHSGGAHERGVSAIEELAHQILRLEAMTDYGRGTTVNVGVVEGGMRANMRPPWARAQIDLRVLNEEEARRMTEAIAGLQPVNPRASLTVSGGITRPPWQPSAESQALFERAQRCGARVGLELWPAGAGGGSDGNFAAALGVPTLDGLGIAGDGAHALTEWADLESLPRRAALLAELILELGK